MIEVHNLSFGFRPETPLLQISKLKINPGEHLAILGPSGSGKSSLLRLIAGLLTPSSGDISIEGKSIKSISENDRRKLRQQSFHFLSQEGNLLADLNLRQNILFPLHSHGCQIIPKEIDHICQSLGLSELLARLPKHCSGGERQKASLARALLHPAPFILADEPTSHLPPADRENLLGFALDHLNLTNRTMVMVTHNHEALDLFPKKIKAPFIDDRAHP